MQYTVIKSEKQYYQYCDLLQGILDKSKHNKKDEDAIELLTLLIEVYDDQHSAFEDVDPIVLLRSCMEDRQLKSKDIASILKVSNGYVSDILNYKKRISRTVGIRLADYFKLSPETFYRAYALQRGEKAA